jgi:hypothetical protein
VPVCPTKSVINILTVHVGKCLFVAVFKVAKTQYLDQMHSFQTALATLMKYVMILCYRKQVSGP